MKFRILRDSALITAAVLAGGKANAQLIDAELTVSSSGNDLGAPVTIDDAIGFYAGPGTPRIPYDADDPDADVIVWSGFDFFGFSNSFPLSANEPLDASGVPTILSDFGFPVEARDPFTQTSQMTANSYSEFLELITDGSFEDYASLNDSILADCFRVSELRQFELGVPSLDTTQLCDEVNSTTTIDGVGISFSAAENSPEFNITIAAAGINFTSDGTQDPITTDDEYQDVVDSLADLSADEIDTFFAYDRGDAFAQFEDFLIDTGASRDLAAAFLGVPVSQLPDAGTLPTDGNFFGFDFNTASAVDPGDVYSLELGASSLGEILGYAALNLGQEDAWDFSRLDTVEEADAADLTLTFLGVSATLDKEANNPNLELISNQLGVEFATTSAIDLDDALEQVGDYIAANEDELTERFTQAVQEVDIATDPTNVVAGNPKSLQGQFTQTLLSLDSPSSLLLETNTAAPSEASSSEESDDDEGAQAVGGRLGTEPAWLIGGRIGTVEAGEEEGVFVDVVAERGFRVGEGGRNRIKVSAPLSYLDFNRIQQSTASVNVGYEHQVIDGKWVVEPSVGAGYAFTNGDVLAGEFEAGALWSAGLSSRLKVANVGRGHIIVGNAVGYSETFDIEVEGSFRSPEVNNTTFRNGVAYQVPVGQRVFDRLGTMRASYTHTKLTGTDVAVDEYHDISFNYGVGSRESTVRNFQETLRVGLNATFGDDYQALSLVAGYKF